MVLALLGTPGCRGLEARRRAPGPRPRRTPHNHKRPARLDDLRRLGQLLTRRGVRITFLKEHLTCTGADTPMAQRLLSVMGAFAAFEQAILGERQREGMALAKQRGAYRGRKKALSPD